MTWRAATALAVGLVLWPTAVASASEAPDEAAYDRAIELLRQGQRKAAADAFAKVADRWPESTRAAGALYAAARLCENKLGDPQRAAALYDRLVDDYPHSRLSLSASRRLASLDVSLGERQGGAAATAAYTQLLATASDLAPAAVVAKARALVRAHPEWPGVPRALLFIAASERRAGHRRAALATYLRAARDYPGGDHRFEAYRGAGLCAFELGRFDLAERSYREMLAVADDPGRQRAAEGALARVDRARLLENLAAAAMVIAVVAVALLGGLLVFSAGSGRAALAAFSRPPTEAIFLAPIATLLVAAAWTGAHSIAISVTAISVAGVVATWLSGAGLAARKRPHRKLIIAHAALAAILVVAVAFAATHETGLIRALENTIDFGPDRA